MEIYVHILLYLCVFNNSLLINVYVVFKYNTCFIGVLIKTQFT